MKAYRGEGFTMKPLVLAIRIALHMQRILKRKES